MKNWFLSKRYGGILWHFVFAGLFIGLSLLLLERLKGTAWYLTSSALRVLFGAAILMTAKRLYGRSPGDILSFRNTRGALLAGPGSCCSSCMTAPPWLPASGALPG